MIKPLIKTFLPLCLLAACDPMGGPREIDWKKEWKENGEKLRQLTTEVKENREKAFKTGINDFPGQFDYPFDDGFAINYGQQGALADTNKITITYYVDRGLLDHYSAFVYTNDSSEMAELDGKVKLGANDHKLADNWYMVND